jgi:hypothetical protein
VTCRDCAKIGGGAAPHLAIALRNRKVGHRVTRPHVLPPDLFLGSPGKSVIRGRRLMVPSRPEGVTRTPVMAARRSSGRVVQATCLGGPAPASARPLLRWTVAAPPDVSRRRVVRSPSATRCPHAHTSEPLPLRTAGARPPVPTAAENPTKASRRPERVTPRPPACGPTALPDHGPRARTGRAGHSPQP